MRLRLGLLLLVLAASVWRLAGDFEATATGAEPLKLRVLSYNIHHGEGEDRKLDLPRIADVIKSVEPDLVSLQEVDRNVKRSQSVDQPAELGRLTGMHVVFGGNIKLQGGDYGNAILSRFPIKSHENRLLPNFENGEQRGVLEAEITLPDGRPALYLMATHFDHRPKDEERFESAKRINSWVEKHPDRLYLLVGDLNARPTSRPLKELDRLWARSDARELFTIPVAKPTQQIDFILYRRDARWLALETRVLDEAVASDHRAIVATLELKPAP